MRKGKKSSADAWDGLADAGPVLIDMHPAGLEEIDELPLRRKRTVAWLGPGLLVPLAVGLVVGVLGVALLGALASGGPVAALIDSPRNAAQRFLDAWVANDPDKMTAAIAPAQRGQLETYAAQFGLAALRSAGPQIHDLQYTEFDANDKAAKVRVAGHVKQVISQSTVDTPFELVLDTVQVNSRWYLKGISDVKFSP